MIKDFIRWSILVGLFHTCLVADDYKTIQQSTIITTNNGAKHKVVNSDCKLCTRLLKFRKHIPILPKPNNKVEKYFSSIVEKLFSTNNSLSLNINSENLKQNGFDKFDRFRLKNYHLAMWDALSQIYNYHPNDSSFKHISQILSKSPVTLRKVDILGKWRCKTHKLGGIGENITSYSYFTCKIYKNGNKLFLQKISGSQQKIGVLFQEDNYFTFKGCGYISGDELCHYQGNKTNFESRKSKYDEAGILTFSNKNKGMLLLPTPFFESKFDILELKR